MLRAGVLLGVRGNRVIAGCAAQAARVTALAADFRDATEAFLLEFLITALADVTARDHIALAHALFRQFDPGIPVADLEDRVVGLLAKLSDHVILGEDGIYRVYRGPANRTVRFA
jgi:sulfur transfer complex TusBCD TusB component (DsrH family)